MRIPVKNNNTKNTLQILHLLLIVCIFQSGGADKVSARTSDSDGNNSVILFDIPSQPLHQALEVFCQQSGMQFLTSGKRISYSVSNAIKGEYKIEEALLLLLKNTSYYFKFSGKKTVTLHSDASLIADITTEFDQSDLTYELSLSSAKSLQTLNTQPFTNGSVLEEVIVSARFHRERILDSPIAVTKVDIKNHRERDFNDLTETTRYAPNVEFSFGGTSSGSTSAAVIYVRGVGQNDFTPVTDPGVGVYMDGVYLGRTLGSVLEISDLNSIQILRGPQGTLFGRNTIGGAILLESNAATDEVNVNGSLTIGDQGRRGVSLSASTPISDSSAMRISYVGRRMGNYVDRVLAGDELGDQNADTIRTQFYWNFNNNSKLTLSADATRERESSAPETLTHIYMDSDFVQAHNQAIEQSNPSINCQLASIPAQSQTQCLTNNFVSTPFVSNETGPSRNDIDSGGISVTLDWPLRPSIDFKSISAVRYINARFARSADGTPVTVIQTEDSYDQKQLSQEIRLQSHNENHVFYWVGGLYLMSEQASNFSTIESTLPTYPIYFGGDTDNSNQAIFFEGTYKPLPQWLLSLGFRQTHEKKTFLPTSISLPTQTQLIPHKQNTLRFNELTWRASILYHPREQSSVYLTVSRGFKSGGFVHRYFEPSPNGLITFDPEYVTQYEIGYKATFPNQLVRLTTLGFYSDYKDIQTAANPAGQPATITDNAARGHITGFETELLWTPTPSLKLDASIGLQEAAYDGIGSDNVTIDLDDDFIHTPSTSINVGMSYFLSSFYQGQLISRLDWTLRSRIEYEPNNDEHTVEDGYQTFDASVTYEPYENSWSLQIGGHNLSDERYIVAGDSNREFGYALAVYARPRSYYLNFNWKF